MLQPPVRRRTRAANQIQRCYREHALELRANRFLAKLAAQQVAQQAADDLAAEPFMLAGVARRCWPVLREALMVMLAAVALGLVAPPAFSALPGAFNVDAASTVAAQLCLSLAGAGTLVGIFLVLFVVMFGLYVHGATCALLAVHSLYIGALLAPPFALLLVRCAQVWRAPLDAPLLMLLTLNFALPGVVVVHWSATAARFGLVRRFYGAALSVLAAWLLASLPWQTLGCVLMLLVVVDGLLVFDWCGVSPVRRLDALQRYRRELDGEQPMPGLTFKTDVFGGSGGGGEHDGDGGGRDGDRSGRLALELGLGDFVLYAAVAAAGAARGGALGVVAAVLGVLAGLTPTMAHLALAQTRTVIPALPAALTLAVGTLALTITLLVPFVAEMRELGVVL